MSRFLDPNVRTFLLKNLVEEENTLKNATEELDRCCQRLAMQRQRVEALRASAPLWKDDLSNLHVGGE